MNNRWHVLSTVLLVCLAMAACKPAPIASVRRPVHRFCRLLCHLRACRRLAHQTRPATSTPLFVSHLQPFHRRPWFCQAGRPLVLPSQPMCNCRLVFVLLSLLGSTTRAPDLRTDGVLYVAERGANRIVALVDANNDGVADMRPSWRIISSRRRRSRLRWTDHFTWGETTRITRLDLIPPPIAPSSVMW